MLSLSARAVAAPPCSAVSAHDSLCRVDGTVPITRSVRQLPDAATISETTEDYYLQHRSVVLLAVSEACHESNFQRKLQMVLIL